jgi:hypothetical protein
MTTTIVRYRVRPEWAARNEELIRAVFDELRELAPSAFRYQVLVLDDGVSFVHVVEYEQGTNPLPGLASFRRYTAKVRERCEDQPVVTEVREVGSIDSRTTGMSALDGGRRSGGTKLPPTDAKEHARDERAS